MRISDWSSDVCSSDLTFAKMASCITGPYDPVHRPRVSDSLDYEGELGIVISRRCRHVPRDRALEVVAGYVVVNDLTVREWVTLTPQVVVPKSFDTHGPDRKSTRLNSSHYCASRMPS